MVRRKTTPKHIKTETPAEPTEQAEVPESVETPTTPPETEQTTEQTEEGSTEIALRRPRKKQRRPTLSDKIPAVPVAAFHRLVREIGDSVRTDMRWEERALEALQTDTEAYMTERFQKAKTVLDLFGRSTSARHLNCLLREGLC